MIRFACLLISFALIPLGADAQWCGTYRQTYYQPYYYVPPARPQTNITHNTTNNFAPEQPKDWRSLIVELAQIREQNETAILKVQADHKAYIEALAALGYSANQSYQQQSYGNAIGSVGNTQYGYSAQTVLQAYGVLDLNSLYLAASQLTRGAQQLGSQATTEFNGLVGQAGQNQARIAEILARATAAKQVLDSLEQTKTTIVNSVNEFGSGPQLQNGNWNGNGQQQNQQLAQVLQTKCAACHNSSKRRGNFNAADYLNMSPEEKGYVISLLTTNDPNRRMPRISDGSRLGKPGALFAEEIELFKR